MGQIVRTPIVLASSVAVTVSGNYILLSGNDINGNTITSTLYAPGATVGGSQTTGFEAYSGGQVGVYTAVCANTASLLEGFVITQLNLETNTWQSYVFQTMTPATGGNYDVAAAAALASQVEAINSTNGGGSLNVTATTGGTGTVTLTTTNNNNIMYVSAIGSVTVAVTPPDGSNPVGSGAQVASLPFIQGQASTSATYDTIIFNGFNPDVNMLINKSEYGIEQTIYIDTTASGWAAPGTAQTDWATALTNAGII